MKYLSPSTFITFKKCEYRVYLEKIRRVLPEEDRMANQTMAMAAGTAFDIMVKGTLNRRIKISEELGVSILAKNSAAVQVAAELFECYQKGPLQEMRKEGIGYGAVDQEISIHWDKKKCLECSAIYPNTHGISCTFGGNTVHEYSETKFESILYGRPDLVLTDGTVIDWKVQGMFGRGKKPDPGYTRCYVFGAGEQFNGRDAGPLEPERSLPDISRDWAIQLYLYSRLLGHIPGNPLRGGIENICVTADNVVRCASYRNVIPVSFQLEMEEAFHDAFARLSAGDPKKIEPPMPAKYRCISYGKLCPVAEHCEEYKRHGI